MNDDEDVPLDQGMPIESADGDALGKLGSVLVDEESEEAAFLTLETSAGDRLVPFEIVMGVEDGVLVLDATPDQIAKLPKASADRDPTDAEIELAYRVLGFEEE